MCDGGATERDVVTTHTEDRHTDPDTHHTDTVMGHPTRVAPCEPTRDLRRGERDQQTMKPQAVVFSFSGTDMIGPVRSLMLRVDPKIDVTHADFNDKIFGMARLIKGHVSEWGDVIVESEYKVLQEDVTYYLASST